MIVKSIPTPPPVLPTQSSITTLKKTLFSGVAAPVPAHVKVGIRGHGAHHDRGQLWWRLRPSTGEGDSETFKNSGWKRGGDPGGIRTLDLDLERVACWASAPQGLN
jgi:hypothetical protein